MLVEFVTLSDIVFFIKKGCGMVINRRHVFWFCFVFLSGLSAALSYKYFDVVAPIVQLSITADKDQVVVSAHKIASDLDWDMTGYQTSVQFASDANLQSFIELEAGEKDAFIQMFQSGAYYPYQWQVRFFKEHEIVEMKVLFSPEGEKIGFYQKVSEKSQGNTLSKEQAMALVEKNISLWCPNFDRYTLVEYNSEKQDTGRVDHSFVYERTDLTIGKGLYRFTAVVCGDVLTQCEPSVKIPDEFLRRYKEMRSANELLAHFGSFIFKLVYLFILALFGMIYLYRRNYLFAKAAFLTSFCVAILEFFSGLNEYQLWWNSYNTIQSTSTFIMMKCFGIFLEFFVLLTFVFVGLVVAEAAGRLIYKHHIQFFSSLQWPVITSQELFNQVLIAYLCTPCMFGYEILYSYLTDHYLAWWSPASSMADPNVVASYLPWFGPISISIRAGFTEEVLFRALPLAMIALVTQKSKHKKVWFAVMFMLQALVFGACHANYPNQPFFARLVELIIPSFGFGFLYCKFGLIPGALCHFVYDAILFALPVFSSTLLFSKVMVVFLIGLPLWTVCALFLYNKKLQTAPVELYNEAFHAAEYIPVQPEPRKIGSKIPARNLIIALFLGLIGSCLWFMTDHNRSDVGVLQVTKAQAIACAAKALEKEYHIDVLSNFDAIATVQDQTMNSQHRFIWQVYGKEVYQDMQCSYLQGVTWLVRFVQFSRPVEERCQELRAYIANAYCTQDVEIDEICPEVIGLQHYIPEHHTGADISEEKALDIAYAYIQDRFLLDKQNVELISVVSKKLEHRRDWTIVVQDLEFFDFNQEGQARIQITISGDLVTEYSRFIFVPEDWSRADQAFLINLSMYKIALYFILILFVLIACIVGINKLLTSLYGTKILRNKVLFVCTLVTIMSINNFCIYVGTFNTAEPFYEQSSRVLLQIVLGNILQIFFFSVFLTIAAVGFIKSKTRNYLQSFGVAVSVGLFLSGLFAYAHRYEALLQPRTGNAACAGAWLPALSFCGSMLTQYCLFASLLIGMFLLVKRFSTIWVQFVVVVFFSCSLQALFVSQSLSGMALQGIVMAIALYVVYRLVLQYDMTLLPVVIAIVFIMNHCLPEIMHPSYTGSALHAFLAIGMLLIVSLFFYKQSHIE